MTVIESQILRGTPRDAARSLCPGVFRYTDAFRVELAFEVL
jgi:hypothetical protein